MKMKNQKSVIIPEYYACGFRALEVFPLNTGKG
jgi:dTDP-4-dehydrorhamnose 3,5-epimerase-like enzyme